MDLEKLVSTDSSSLQADVTYNISESRQLVLTISYVSREDFTRMSDQCRKPVFDSSLGQSIPSLDSDLLRRKFIEKCVKNWKGMTYRVLTTLVPIDVKYLREQVTGTKAEKGEKFSLDNEISYNPELLFIILKKSYSIESWLSESAKNLVLFQSDVDNLEAELKK